MATSGAGTGSASMTTRRGKQTTWNRESSERRMKNLSWQGRKRRCWPLVSCAAAPWFQSRLQECERDERQRIWRRRGEQLEWERRPSCRANGERKGRQERTDDFDGRRDDRRLRVSGGTRFSKLSIYSAIGYSFVWSRWEISPQIRFFSGISPDTCIYNFL